MSEMGERRSFLTRMRASLPSILTLPIFLGTESRPYFMGLK
jgi:hypothetical protein